MLEFNNCPLILISQIYFKLKVPFWQLDLGQTGSDTGWNQLKLLLSEDPSYLIGTERYVYHLAETSRIKEL